MIKKVLMTGNEAMAEAAIAAGCRFYAGYPITPQNEIPAYLASRMPQVGGVFIQAESEIAAINMVFGAAAAGARAMTSSSSPGISLKQEGISYLAGSELPCVIVNVMRGGPGLGNIMPSQADYFQATRGGGHGDYRCLVFAPSSVQEAYDLVGLAFELSDRYRTPALILGDGTLGQMMEPLELRDERTTKSETLSKPWALTGCRGRAPNVVKSFYLGEGDLERCNLRLQKKYEAAQKKEQRYEAFCIDDAEIIIVAYGTLARIAKSVVRQLREKGKKIGLIRPITLWPFPDKILRALCLRRRRPKIFVTEMSYGQMLDDVKLALEGKLSISFYGRSGGGVPLEQHIRQKIVKLLRG
jgi:2-oxoglutarate ferredoxin oxidoreductase subunit alpha